MTELIIDDLSIAYGNKQVLSHIALPAFAPGALVGVLGPNGVGKSSFLRALAGLNTYTGSAKLNGIEINRMAHQTRARHIGYLPQTLPQGTSLVAYEAVLSACRAVRTDLLHNAAQALVEATFEQLGITSLAFQALNQMSGGQRQMVGLAQVIVRAPHIMLLDEPTSALDLRWQLRVLDVVRRIARQQQGLALMALHDINLALRHCDHIVLFGNGAVLASDTAQNIMTPERLHDAYQVDGRIEYCSRGTPFVIVDSLSCATSPPQEN
ncbi:ABC transporter ATP-binding protein [Thalassospira sp. NFXS8]|uniref:ABC transporter ATP-binding protein n=1 Tax=Thalassospira sp. NFXS8 TaxID=2819093 RepID=UPI0032DE7508